MDKQILKQWFSRGKKPTGEQFAAWIDSFFHKDEKIPMAAVEGLVDQLDSKPSLNVVQTLIKENTTDKQDKVDQSLLTKDKTVVGAINSVAKNAVIRSHTFDFSTGSDIIQFINMLDEITIDRVVFHNVLQLFVSYGDVVRRSVDPGNQKSFKVPADAVMSWEIVREVEGSSAAVGIRTTIVEQ